MIIRSQDKERIVNINCVDTIAVIDTELVYFSGDKGTMGTLGVYSTKEKSIKVLDMIQERYSEFCCNEFRSVFEMPQDREV